MTTSTKTGIGTWGSAAASASNLGTALLALPRMPESSAGHTIVVSAGGSVSSALSGAVDGDVIQLHGGSYGVTTLTSRRFSALNPVTITNFPGETVTFTGQATGPANGLTLQNCKGIRLRGVSVACLVHTNVKIDTCQNIELDGCIIRDSARDAPSTVGYHAGMGLLVVGQGGSGFASTFCEDIQVWNSVFFNNGGNSPTQDFAYDHSVYFGSGGTLFGTETKHGVDSGVFANNLVYNQPTGFGIQLGESCRNTFVVNNTIDSIVYGQQFVGSGMVIWASGDSWGSNGNEIVNNIFSHCAANGVSCSLSQSVSNIVRNNLGFSNLESTNWATGGNFNPTYGTKTGFTGSNLSGDPVYRNRTLRDYTPLTGSAAIGVSDPAYTPAYDASGVPRPALPALGALVSA